MNLYEQRLKRVLEIYRPIQHIQGKNSKRKLQNICTEADRRDKIAKSIKRGQMKLMSSPRSAERNSSTERGTKALGLPRTECQTCTYQQSDIKGVA